MQNNVPNTVKGYLKSHSKQRKWRSIVVCLSCFVILGTIYALTFPATTMSTDTFCGLEEHVHSEECYEQVLVCENAAPAELPVHMHSDDCYEVQRKLVCTQEMNEDGTEHEHTDECYQDEAVLVCPIEETAEDKSAEHIHSEECYAMELICEKQEHTHTLQCHSNPYAVENSDLWTQGIPTLSGKPVQDLVAMAESQLGYTESTENFRVNEDGSLSGYTRYGAWYGGANDSDFAYGDWCASFVSFCLNYAGIPQSDFPYSAGCEDWTARLTERGLYKEAANHTPQAGDIVFLNMNGYGADHVGIVTDSDENTVYTIEGNLNGSVARSSHSLIGGEILGYGVLPDNQAEDVEVPENDAQISTVSDGHETIEISVSTRQSTYHDPKTAEDGTLLYYTGESAVTTLNISNPTSSAVAEDDGAVVRLYMKFSDAASEEGRQSVSGTPSMLPGEYTISAKSGVVYKYTVTKLENDTYCFEIQRPINGDTINLQLPSGYPSPTSAGGTNEVWGVVLTKEEKEALDAAGTTGIAPKPADGSDQQVIRWETKADDFILKKYQQGASVKNLELKGDGKGGAYLSNLEWEIELKRTGNTLEGVGKDYMTYAEYSDTITLPEGMTWDSDAYGSIQDGSCSLTYTYVRERGGYAWQISDKNGRIFAELGAVNSSSTVSDYNTMLSAETPELSLTEDGKVNIRWKVYHQQFAAEQEEVRKTDVPSTEMKAFTTALTIKDNVLLVEKPETDKDYVIHNEVDCRKHYSWSAPQEDNAQNDVKVTPGSGRFVLTKTRTSPDSSKMGAPASYTITAENPGIGSFDSFAYLEDTLPNGLYLSGNDMVQLLTDAQFGNRLTITIQKATICKTPDPVDVTDTSGNAIGGITAGNSSPDGNPNKYHGKQSVDPSVIDENGTIALERDGDSIRITYGDKSVTCLPDGSAIQSALDVMGLVITKNTTYKLSWDMTDENGTAYSLAGGEKLTFDLPCTVKTTFMNLEQDTDYRYPNFYLSMGYNYVFAYSTEQKTDGSKKEIANASARPFSANYEVSLTKNAMTADGAALDKLPENGSVINYTLNVYTSGTQTAPLPLTDHMSGGQVLLAKVEENKGAEWASDMKADDIFTDTDGTQYYKLKTPGEYRNVRLNGKLADTVIVSDSADGRDTVIKWYLGSFTNNTERYSYRALFCPEELTPSAATWSLGNESWMNDHETHRLYASIPRLETTTFSFSKRIVSQADIDADKKEVGTDYSAVSEGETVYYRLAFYPAENTEYTITGKDLYDVLPLGLTQGNTEVLSWKKDSSETPGSIWVMDYQGYTSGSLQNGNNYHVTTDASDKNQQMLVWDDDFRFTVGAEPVYIYLRLTFPEGNAWEKYAAKYSSEKLKNTLYVHDISDEVTHTLGIPAKAYLQKGVYTTEGYRRVNSDAPIRPTGGDSLFYYSNNDALYHTVTYYVVLYNAGTTKLYVQDLQDILPEGFSLKWLRWDGSINQDKRWTDGLNQVTNGEGFGKSTTGERVTWKSVHVVASVDKNDPQKVSFRISKGNSGSSIAYDEEVGMYYLNPKEGLSFGYSCATNNREDTQDIAVNRIAMPYYDFNEGGVVVSNTSSFARDRSLNRGTPDYLPNEGTCNVMDNAQAEQSGFTGGEAGTQWLTSDVTVVRGDIQPGITKALTSVVTASGNENKGPIIAAHPTDTLRWTITADNDGEYGIQDYVLTDTMQSPYEFTGKVNYVIKSQSGSMCAQAVNGYLFSIDEVDNGTVTLKSNGGSTATAEINSAPVEIKSNWLNARSGGGARLLPIKVQFKEDAENGTVTISIRFEGLEFGIPQDSSGVLTLDTKNPSNNLENRVYVNSCFITPMSQVWDGTASKGNMTTLDAQDVGEKPTVRNSAPVTTSYGYTTSSLKSVMQADDPSNATDCNSTPNYIVLPDKQTMFTYTLSVENADKAMDSIVLIDGLPEPGDHTSFQSDDPRFSEFKVRFADDPRISVSVIAQDNTVTELSPDQFTAEFSTKTDFDRYDWAGSSVWNSSLAEARSLRIKIKDDSGTLIPAKATLSVRFNAVIEGDAAPGQIAWNSFGYHYSVVGGGGDLEAAPLKVGVMLPTIPKIQKTLTGNDGAAMSAVQDEAFRFLCYTGTSLKIAEENRLGEALNAAKRKATLIELRVPTGSPASELTALSDCMVWDYTDNGWVKTEEPWSWIDQAQYTLVELPSEEPLYLFGSINKSATATGYSFYYRSGEQLTLSAVNVLDTWNFTIRKVDADDASPLNGAWFALYSPNEEDKLTQKAYEGIMAVPHQKPAETVEYNGRTWYLTQVGQSQEQNGMSGVLLWDGLFRDEYLYCEVQAPQGHALDSTIHLVRKDDSVHSITITNEKSGYELPQTGGFGTMPIYLAGVALLLTAGMLSPRKKRTRT